MLAYLVAGLAAAAPVPKTPPPPPEAPRFDLRFPAHSCPPNNHLRYRVAVHITTMGGDTVRIETPIVACQGESAAGILAQVLKGRWVAADARSPGWQPGQPEVQQHGDTAVYGLYRPNGTFDPVARVAWRAVDDSPGGTSPPVAATATPGVELAELTPLADTPAAGGGKK